MIHKLIFCTLLVLAFSATTSPSWIAHSDIKCGRISEYSGSSALITSTSTTPITLTVPYPSTLSSSRTGGFLGSKYINSGIIDFQSDSNSQFFGIEAFLTSLTINSATVAIRLFDGTSINSLRISYFCFVFTIINFFTLSLTASNYGAGDAVF